MVMYTERQLDLAYAAYVVQLTKIKVEQGIEIFIPDREDFRKIYEAVWEDILEDDWYADDNSLRHQNMIEYILGFITPFVAYIVFALYQNLK